MANVTALNAYAANGECIVDLEEVPNIGRDRTETTAHERRRVSE